MGAVCVCVVRKRSASGGGHRGRGARASRVAAGMCGAVSPVCFLYSATEANLHTQGWPFYWGGLRAQSAFTGRSREWRR